MVAFVVYIIFITRTAVLSVYNSLIKVVNGTFTSGVSLEQIALVTQKYYMKSTGELYLFCGGIFFHKAHRRFQNRTFKKCPMQRGSGAS